MTDQALSRHDDARQLAQQCVDAMLANDAASRMLGIHIKVIQAASIDAQMTVRADMTNGHNICHGGLIFSLADSAFAYASNSTNRNTVASACHIDFIAPALLDDTLTAQARERTRSGRTSVYDVEVYNQRNELIALFRGKGYQIRGSIIPSTGEHS